MELCDNLKQLVALVGYDDDDKQTVISICTPHEIKKTVQVIYDAWPNTIVIGQYELTLKAREQRSYSREEVATL